MDDDQGRGPRDQSQDSIPAAGTQAGGGPDAADMAAPGGSSGEGGYGRGQNQQFHQGQEPGPARDDGLSRGERFDEAQGGGRGPESVSLDQEDREGATLSDGGEADADD